MRNKNSVRHPEAIYGSMPAFGLGRVGTLVPASGQRDSARGRMTGAKGPEAETLPAP